VERSSAVAGSFDQIDAGSKENEAHHKRNNRICFAQAQAANTHKPNGTNDDADDT
jgi:hypothetical protein